MENYIFSMRNGSKVRVPLSDAKSVEKEIANALSRVDEHTNSVNYVFT